MKKQNWLLIVAVILLSAFVPLWFAPPRRPAPTAARPDLRRCGRAGQQAIGQLAPGYEPWFAPLIEPASGEIASLLFALQAAFGAGVIGYWLGCAVTRDRRRRHAGEQAATPEDTAC